MFVGHSGLLYGFICVYRKNLVWREQQTNLECILELYVL